MRPVEQKPGQQAIPDSQSSGRALTVKYLFYLFLQSSKNHCSALPLHASYHALPDRYQVQRRHACPGPVPVSGLGTGLRVHAQARMHLPRPGCWHENGLSVQLRDACSCHVPVAGMGSGLRVHAAEAKKHLLQVLLYAFVCSCLGQVPGMVSSSGHVPEAACGIRSISGSRAYQSALLRVKRVISAGTSMRQEKPDQMPVPLLTYR